MSKLEKKTLVTFVVGPTASGKSSWALNSLSRLQDEGKKVALVNCDSIQVFAGLKIGSAFPTEQELAQVPHHLFGHVAKGQNYTAGQYARDFHELMQRLSLDRDEVFVVGGTGFYFQAIEKGLFEIGAADPAVRAQVEEELQSPGGATKLHQELSAKDATTAARISVNDHYRLVRAIEMMRTHHKTVTEIQHDFAKKQKPFPWPLKKIGFTGPKPEMLNRVTQRSQKMLSRGLIDEVENLFQQGYQDWEALQSVGYREVVAFLKQQPLQDHLIQTREELLERIIQNTMKLVKKQKTWFQRDPEIQWQELQK